MENIDTFDIVVTIMAIIIMLISIYLAYYNLFFLLFVPGCIMIPFYVWLAILEKNQIIKISKQSMKYRNMQNEIKK